MFLLVANIAHTLWLADELTVNRPLEPAGAFSEPFNARGGPTFISETDQIRWRLSFYGGFVMAGVILLVNRAWGVRGKKEQM